MVEVLKDLSFWAIVVSVLVLGVQQVQRRIDRRKELTIAVSFDKRILSHKEEELAGLSIGLHGEQIQDAYHVVFSIENTGSSPVAPDDYSEPISIMFGREAEVVSVVPDEYRVPRTLKDDVLRELTHSGSSLQLPPMLMNPGDQRHFHTVVSRYSAFEAVGHVKGTHITLSKPERGISKVVFLVSMACFAYAVANSWPPVVELRQAIMALLSAIGGTILATTGLILYSRTHLVTLGPKSR